jgi:hypothetical protein
MRTLIRCVLVLAAAGGFGATGARAQTPEVRGGNVAVIPAGGVHVYTEYFHKGEVVTVAVSGDGDTDLDLYVFGPRNPYVPLAADEDDTDDCVVRFRAPANGSYTLKVVNRGRLGNRYAIALGVDR